MEARSQLRHRPNLRVLSLYTTLTALHALTGRSPAAYNEIMPPGAPALSHSLVCLIASGLSSCLARRRVITRHRRQNHARFCCVADRDTLLDAHRHTVSTPIHDFSATVDMVPALGSAEKNQITEYKDVRGYILFRKPADIRIIGLLPGGAQQSLRHGLERHAISSSTSHPRTASSPAATRSNELSANKIENLRPQHFLDAMLVRPLDPDEKPRCCSRTSPTKTTPSTSSTDS